MAKDPKTPPPDDADWKEIEPEFDEAWLEPEAWNKVVADDKKE